MAQIIVGTSNDARVKPYFYSADRLTFAYSDYLRFQIDNDPAPGGKKGQIVVTDHDEETIDWVAGSLEEFVEHGFDRLRKALDGEDVDDEDFCEPAVNQLSRKRTVGRRKVVRISAEPSPGETLDQILEQFQAWLKQNAPQTASQLRKGLKKEKISFALKKWEVDQEWAFPFPDALYPLFEHFDGQRSTRTSLLPSPIGTPSGMTLGSLEFVNAWRNGESGLVYLYKGLEFFASLQIDAEIRRDFWNDHWFPFATGQHITDDENLSCLLFIDMDPAAGGKTGQIVLQLKEAEDFSTMHLQRRVIAPSLAAYFKGLVENMRIGKIINDPKIGLCHAS